MKKKEIDIDLLKKYYLEENLNVYDTAEKLGIGSSLVSRILKKENIKKTREQIFECKKKTCKKNYGTDCPSQSSVVRDRIKKTCQERYGADVPAKSEEVLSKMKKTCKERYGVENIMFLDEFRERVESTTEQKYGNRCVFNVPEIKEKIKNTMLQEYGVEKPFQSREILEKARESFSKNHNGASSFLTTEEGKKYLEERLEKKYGVKNASHIPGHAERVKKTLISHYGVENTMDIPHVREKIEEGSIKKFGVKNPVYSKEWQDKVHRDFFEKYGCSTIMQTNWPSGTYEILSSKENFLNFIKTQKDKTRVGLSLALGCSFCVVCKYIKKYNLTSEINTIASHPELEISMFLDEIGVEHYKTKNIISPYEIDFYCPKYRIGIEFNGSFWHSVEQKGENYHVMKTNLAKEKGIFIYHIFESDWRNENKRAQVLSFLKILFSPDGVKNIVSSIKESGLEEIVSDRAYEDDEWFISAGYKLVSYIPPRRHTVYNTKNTYYTIYDCGGGVWKKEKEEEEGEI